MNSMTNMIILLSLALLSFVPIKYVYPSHLDYLTDNKYLRIGMVIITMIWGAATSGLLWLYPQSNSFLVAISVGYTLLYIGISLYRTWVPLNSLTFVQE
jgi:phosphatidylcholine synthase